MVESNVCSNIVSCPITFVEKCLERLQKDRINEFIVVFFQKHLMRNIDL